MRHTNAEFIVNLCILFILCAVPFYRNSDGYDSCPKLEKHYFTEIPSVTLDSRLESRMKEKLLLSPFVSFRQLFLVAPRYNLATCIIEKVMSTFRNALFCYLNKPWLFEKGRKNISDVRWEDSTCESGVSYRRTSQEAALQSLNHNPVIFVVIRDPLQRFISGYTNKCVINHGICRFECNLDMLCFLSSLREIFFSYQKDPRKMMSSEEISRMVHFAPMTWYCHSIDFLKSMHVIRHDMLRRKQMVKEYDRILQTAGISMQQRSYIRFEMIRRLPVHATWNKSVRVNVENQLLSNRTIFEMFLQLYYHDFIIFGYDFPKPQYIL